MTVLLEVQNLDYTINTQKQILKNISFSVKQGEMIALIGANGAGKTTLLKILASIHSDFSGQIFCEGQSYKNLSLKQRAKKISYIAQQSFSAWSLTTQEIIALGRLPFGRSLDDFTAEDKKICDTILELCSLTALKYRPIHSLSGGEKARVWLARALATQAQILLADEPLSHLDPFYQFMFMNILKNIKQNGAGIIIALHDIGLAMQYADKILLLNKGHILAFDTPHHILHSGLLEKTFHIQLLHTKHNSENHVMVLEDKKYSVV